MNIIDILDDPRFFKPLFQDQRSWGAWRVFLKALFGVPITDCSEKKLLRECTGLGKQKAGPPREAYVIAGRRSGKSFMSSLIAVYLASFKDWTPYLNPGEKGWIFIIATDKEQAKIIKNYISGILHSNDLFKRLIEREMQTEIELKNGVMIAVKTCNYRTVRGFTVLAAICEEIAFWRDDSSANPAEEVLAALRPALATVPDSMLIGISTPYSRSGLLWEQYRKHFGNSDSHSPLVWKAPTKVMNPTIDAQIIESDLHGDYSRAKAEWEAEWREDIEGFLSLEAVEAIVVPGRFELPKVANVTYSAFMDPSGGRNDSFTLAICHKDGSNKVILDCVREAKPPFQPQNVVEEFTGILHNYDISNVESDKYAAEWVVDAFRRNGIIVVNSELSASEIYMNFLPLVMNGSVELLDNPRLIEQLRGLERRTRAGGKDLISHNLYSGAHDDLAVAVAGAALRANRYISPFSAEFLAATMYPQPMLSQEEKFNRNVANWLLGKPQDP